MNALNGKLARLGFSALLSLLVAGCFEFTKETTAQLSGSVGDGPVINAEIKVFDRAGNELASSSSDTFASYSVTVETEDDSYPLIIEARGGTDLVTGTAPDFVLKSAALSPSPSITANINPFTTLIVETAIRSPGGLNAETLGSATAAVVSQLNFGLDPALLSDPMEGQVTASNIASVVKASEALGETIRRVRGALAAAGFGKSADQIVVAIAADMVDGVLDGRGAGGADARVAAVANVVAAQVAVESLSNDLTVLGNRAEPLMDGAIVVSMPDAPASARTGNVTANADLLAQTLQALGAVATVAPSSGMDSVIAAVDQLNPGATAAQARSTLPSQASSDLASVVTQVAQGSEAELEAVNGYIRGDRPEETPPQNSAPEISGTPATSVDAGSSYYFRPVGFDADGDTLSYSISGEPSWASFSAINGTLSGTPGDADAGASSSIVISVSDGQASAALPAFTITVNSTASENSAPTISGSPASQVTAGYNYSFQPQADDADGDALTFSIAGKPDWASFNSSNGQLSGIAGAVHVGSWENIRISVSDGQLTATLPAFSIEVVPLEEEELSATRLVQQQNNTGTLQEVTVVANGAPLEGQVVSGLLRVRSEVDGAGLYCCQSYRYGSNGSPVVEVSHNSAWTARPVTAGSVHEFDTTTLPNGDYELYLEVDSATEAYIVFTVQNDGSTPPPPPANRAPVITGSPASQVDAGQAYAFQPQASDPDGDALSFSIANKPAWATFSSSTGRLAGTPGSGNAGTISGISITVSDGQASATLGPFSITVNDPQPENRAPTISGNPPAEVLADSAYSFAPAASDPDGDALQFSVANLPSWASFDSNTGQISGTPSAADVGTYYDIVVTVSDGSLSDSLPAFSVTVTDLATGFALLSWTPPTQRVDGTALDNLAGFKVYHGMSPDSLSMHANVTNAQAVDYYFDGLPAGTHYFAVLAYCEGGLESALSNVASKTIQ